MQGFTTQPRDANRPWQTSVGIVGAMIILAACGGADASVAGGDEVAQTTTSSTTMAPVGTGDAEPPEADSTTTTTTPVPTTTTTTEPPPDLVDPDELVDAVVAATPLFGEPTAVDDVRCFAMETGGLVRIEPAVSLLATSRGDIPTTVVAIHQHEMQPEELQAAANALRACFPETLVDPEYGTEVPSYWWTVAAVLESEI